MKLYTAPISPMGKRVRITALEADVAVEAVNLDVFKGESRGPENLARNPMGKIPTLVDGDFTLWESGAILCYVAQKGRGGVWPTELRAQADTLRWLFFTSCHLDPYFTTLVVERFAKKRRGEPEDAHLAGSAEQWLARFVPIVEQQLVGRPYLVGPFGLADIAVGCTMELSPFVAYDLAPYPNVRAWLERLQGRASWRACALPPGALG